MVTKQKTKRQALTLTIENPNYGEFNGFQITFRGFDKIPKMFMPRGLPRGFRTGKYLLERLRQRFGEFQLTIVKDGESNIITERTPTRVKLRIGDIRRIIASFNTYYRAEGTKAVDRYLGSLFPDHFPQYTHTYRPNALASALPDNLSEITLSNKDIRKLIRLLPVLLEADIKNPNELKRLLEGKKILHYLYLEKIIRDFEKRLDRKSNEHTWQKFFRQNLLILNPGYIEIIEKPNISLSIQLPDFLLLTLDNYVDIYEIKRPDTPLLAYDNDHKNYYWSSDIAKAISQVENYIESISNNSYAVAAEIGKLLNLELNIVRPRGYIIAGHSKELRESKKRGDDFRILNNSLHATTVLPYDEFLERSKNLSKTLKEVSR
jgi:hypothetical protein